MDLLIEWLPLLLPLIIIELGLLIFAVADIAKKKKTKNLSPLIWIIIIIVGLSSFIGPVLYFIVGRADMPADDDI